MKSSHYIERVEGRIAKLSNNLSIDDIYKLYNKLERLEALTLPVTKSYGVKLLSLSTTIRYNSGKSNGNEVWVIVRQGILQTIMLRSSLQSEHRLNVDNVFSL